jgi:TIR domain
MSSYAFISYAREDRTYVEALVAYLGTSGMSVWFDHEIAVGDRFDRVIRERIDSCAAFIVVMSPAADRSEYIALEVARAKQSGKRILPLLLADEPLFALSMLHYTDVRNHIMPHPGFVAQLTATLDAAEGGDLESEVAKRTPSGIFDYLARNRPSRHRTSTTFRVVRHAASDIIHEVILSSILAETLYSWPEGTMFVVDYDEGKYAQGTFGGDRLMTEIGVVESSRLEEAVLLGWIDPSGPAKESAEFASRAIWWENPVKEWSYSGESLANVAAFVARGVERVLGVDPAKGYSVEIFHNNDLEKEQIRVAAKRLANRTRNREMGGRVIARTVLSRPS